MTYIQFDDPIRPVTARSSFQAGQLTQKEADRERIERLLELLRQSVNLYAHGKAYESIFTPLPIKEGSEKEAMRIIGEIEKELLGE